MGDTEQNLGNGAGATNHFVGVSGSAASPQTVSTFPTINQYGGRSSGSRLVVITIIAAAAILATIAVVLIVHNAHPAADVRGKFNQFANFLIHGQASDGDLTADYAHGSSYHLATLNDEQDRKHFLDTAASKYQAFLVQAPAAIKNQATDYAATLELFIYNQNYPNPTIDQLLQAYLESPDDLSVLIETHYAPFLSAQYDKTKNYGKAHQEQAATVVAAFKTFADNHCLNREKAIISNSCKLNQKFKQANTAIEDYKNSSVPDTADVYRELWELKEAVYAL